MRIKLLILSLLFCFSLQGQKYTNHTSEVRSGKTYIKTRPTPFFYEENGVKVIADTILKREMDVKRFKPEKDKTVKDRDDDVKIKKVHDGYQAKLDAEITLDANLPNVTVKGRNKAIENAEKLAGVNYPMYFAWVDGASTTRGIMKFKDDGNINKVYVVKGTYESPVIQFISEHKIASGTRPYYTRKDGFITVYMDGFSGSGTSGDPYQITSWAELNDMRNHLSSYFILMNNLSSATTGYSTYAASTANSNAGWLPVGVSGGEFTGNFNGQGKVISNLYINRAATEEVGLYGALYNATITNMGISATVSGYNYTGIFAGRSDGGTISNIYTTGTLNVYGYRCGGLIGYNGSTLSNSYSSAQINAIGVETFYIGGFVGQKVGSITNCYSIGAMSTDSEMTLGGFSGTGTATDCFWDTQTSGQATSGGGTGKTTSQMKTLATFTNWSIANKASWTNEAWYIDATVDCPRLGWEMPVVTSNIKNINGVLKANVKLFNGVTNANLKSFNGVQ
jgi:hypothetical protein